MRSGTFVVPPSERVHFGRPYADVVAEEVERLQAQRVLVLASHSLNRHTDRVRLLADRLGERCARVHDAIPAHIPRDAVLEAASVARGIKADLIVTVGGGSVIDAGKNLQLCLEHNVTTLEGFEPFHLKTDPVTGRVHAPQFRAPRVRQVSVPTTLSGAEFTQGAGSHDPASKRKLSVRHPHFTPLAVAFDPALTLHTPLKLWLSTGMRAVDHAVECYCSPLGTPYSDATALQALRILPAALRRTAANPDDLQARADAQTGLWLAQTGLWALVPMGASHGIGHVLSARCGVSHGHCTCVTLPAVLRFNRDVTRDQQRQLAEALGDAAREPADLIAALIDDLHMPSRLSDVGVQHEHFDDIARDAMLERWVHSNPRPIAGPQDILRILQAAA